MGELTVLRELKVQPLKPECIAQAYPLIQTVLPNVPLEAWIAFARALLQPGGPLETGILSIVSEQGYIAGLSSYRVDPSLTHGHSLSADHFVALDMFDRHAVVEALAGALEALALKRRCGAVHTTLRDKNGEGGTDHTKSTLVQRGHRLEAVRLCKALPYIV